MKLKTMKISEFITELQKTRNMVGDVPVYIASDEEGNMYGSVTDSSVGHWPNVEAIVIFPTEQTISFITYDELN